jgi:hypothetical protein
MTKFSTLKISLLMTAVLALPAAQAATMSKDDYKAGKTRISTAYKADKSACSSMKSNAKDICVEEAKAKEKVALAELEYSYTGKPGDQTKVREVKAKTAYAVAKERCDDKAGNDKDVCRQEAKAVETKALVDAKMAKDVADTRKEGAQDKLDADYKVAVEKCDAMAGDAKTSCIASAKAKFGKT